MDMTWAYIAGFFDGEGSIGVSSHASGRKSTAYIAQSGERGLIVLNEILEFLKARGIGGSVFETGLSGKRFLRTMPSYRLSVGGFGGVEKFLTGMIPYLRIKKVFAQDILRYNKLYPNLFKSPLAAAWRREKQLKSAVSGAAWHVRYAGRKMGRPKGSLDKKPRARRIA